MFFCFLLFLCFVFYCFHVYGTFSHICFEVIYVLDNLGDSNGRRSGRLDDARTLPGKGKFCVNLERSAKCHIAKEREERQKGLLLVTLKAAVNHTALR